MTVRPRIQAINVACAYCGIELVIWPCEKKSRNYCSNACADKSRRADVVELTCETCGCMFMRKAHRVVGVRSFCSEHCRRHRAKCKVETICETCGKRLLRYPCYINERNFCSKRCRGLTVPSGPDSPQWRGGRKERQDSGSWRRAVLRAAGRKCAKCGSGKDLEAHHIIPYAQRPDLGADKSNGMCLCESCHTKVHSPKERVVLQLPMNFVHGAKALCN